MGLCRRCVHFINVQFSEGREITRCAVFEMTLPSEAIKCSEFEQDNLLVRPLRRYEVMEWLGSIRPVIIDPDGSRRAGFITEAEDEDE